MFELGTDVTRESLRITVQVSEIVCFLFDCGLSPVIPFPYRDRSEAQEHCIHDAYDGIDEASHLVMALQNLHAYEVAHQQGARDRDKHRPPDKEQAPGPS
jgi:hypothetical protein